MRIWALQRPDLNRLQKTITTACEKERYVRPRERALTTHAKQILNVRTRESSKPVLLAKNRREKNPQLPAKQGESRDVTFPRHTHVPLTSKSPSEAVFIIIHRFLAVVSGRNEMKNEEFHED
jgi:hypothetical protein